MDPAETSVSLIVAFCKPLNAFVLRYCSFVFVRVCVRCMLNLGCVRGVYVLQRDVRA